MRPLDREPPPPARPCSFSGRAAMAAEGPTPVASQGPEHRQLSAESGHLNSYCPEPVRGAILAAKPSVNGGLRQMTRFEIPTLTTDRLLLRAFRADDLDAFAAMR